MTSEEAESIWRLGGSPLTGIETELVHDGKHEVAIVLHYCGPHQVVRAKCGEPVLGQQMFIPPARAGHIPSSFEMRKRKAQENAIVIACRVCVRAWLEEVNAGA